MHPSSLRGQGYLACMGFCSLLALACSLPPERIPQAAILPRTAIGSQLYQKIADLRAQRFVSFEILAQELTTAQVITLGEEHYHPDILTFTLHMVTALTEQRGQRLVLALEFLERDMQADIDAYLQGTLDETTLQQQIKATPAFMRLYFPLLQYARQHGLAVLAPNVPRRLARRVAKEGLQATLATLPAHERRYMPAIPAVATTRYRDYLLEALAGVHVLQASEVEPFVEAAYLKDDTMAESLALFLDKAPDVTVLLLAGRFHTDYGTATPALLRQQRPHLKMQRLTAMPVAPTDTVTLRQLAREDLADYVWFTKPAPPPES